MRWNIRRARQQFVRRVCEALGADNVQRGLEASGHTWQDCFVSRACRDRLGDERLPRRTIAAGQLYGAALGIAPGYIFEIARLWDRDEMEFRAVASDWLRRHDIHSGVGAPGESFRLPPRPGSPPERHVNPLTRQRAGEARS